MGSGLCPLPRASDAAVYKFPDHEQFILEAAHQREAPRAGSSSRIYLSIEKVGIAKTDARLCENKNQSSSTSEVRSEWSGRPGDRGERSKKLQIEQKGKAQARNCRRNPSAWLVACQRKSLLDGGATVALTWQEFRRNLRFPAIMTHSSISRTLYFANVTRTHNTYLVPERHHTTIGANPTIPKRTGEES